MRGGVQDRGCYNVHPTDGSDRACVPENVHPATGRIPGGDRACVPDNAHSTDGRISVPGNDHSTNGAGGGMFQTDHDSALNSHRSHRVSGTAPGGGGTHGGHQLAGSPLIRNDVDSWIDDLQLNRCNTQRSWTQGGVNNDVMMAWMVQQHLPKAELPTFDGAPGDWVDFITKFRDLVHQQEYLNDGQRIRFLLQQLKGEARRAVKGFANDTKGYVLALQKLKYLFGQRPMVAQAVLSKVTKGKAIQNDDMKGLSEFLYNISDCLITLTQLNYESDLHSSDTLRQAVQRLPQRLVGKWSERSLSIRRYEEPNLKHLESWLQDRVLALKELHQSTRPASKKKDGDDPPKKKNLDEKFTCLTTKEGEETPKTQTCPVCKQKHTVTKCPTFKDLPPLAKMKTVRNLKLCFNCLTQGHKGEECSSRHSCFEAGCKDRHNTLLHGYFVERAKIEEKLPPKKEEPKKDGEGGEEKKVGMTRGSSSRKKVILQIVPVTLHAEEGATFDTHALLDNCSELTLVRDDVIKKMGLECRKTDVNISTVKDKAEAFRLSEVSLKVSARNGENPLEVDAAYSAPGTRFNMPRRPRLSDSVDADLYTHLDGIDLHEVNPEDISILIGADVPEAHLQLEVRRGSKGQPLAVKTPFGWCLFGPRVQGGETMQGGESSHCGATYTADEMRSFWELDEQPPSYHVNLITREDENLHESLEKFWAVENCGIVPQDVAMSKEDVNASLILEEGTKNIGDRYEVPMLWMNPEVILPNNLPLAMKRHRFLKKRLRANINLHAGMNSVIKGYCEADPPHARKMTTEEANQTSNKTYYMPIHPVVNVNKPGKTRVVNDAAAEYQGVSLNKSLLTGPDLLSSLVGILINFRIGRIAIAADIEAMFHQVRVSLEDADCFRFLWQEDLSSDDPPDTYQMLVHIFGAKDSPTCCNYALKRTARDNADSYDALTIESALKAFYVDDLLKSVNDEETAIFLAKELMSLLKRGGFRLCKFVSNSEAVLDALPESEVSPKAIVDLDIESVDRALGVSWNKKRDEFTFTLVIELVDEVTKRVILRITCRIFDPLGLLAPFILKAKLLLQELWRLGFDWDQPINEAQKKYWEKWLAGAREVSQVSVNRRYVTDERPVDEIQLHIFCDASELAYGCVGYLRYSFKEGGYACAFVMSKSRLAPIKAVTLPRLELNAARTGARLSKLILRDIDLPVQRLQFWSDSTLTLQYINNVKHRLKAFVANRQTDILEVSEPNQWRHVPGDMNPADLLTRGVMTPVELNSTNWFTGPDFLLQEEESWPKLEVEELNGDDVEIRNRPVLVALGMVVEVERIDMSRFRTWLRLKRVIAWIVRFISNCQRAKEDRDSQCLTVDEINDAEHLIIKDVQTTAFSEEISSIEQGQSIQTSSKLAPLCPFVDSEGVLRVGGRLGDLTIPITMKHPPILARSHPATRLLIEWTHRRNGHVGPEHVLALIREAYWIISARIAINQVVNRCFFCRVKRARKQFPFMANLPQCRAAIDEPPFSHCGVDLFGPVKIKQGRKQIKRWVTLFTCLTIRCVHLEVVEDCETDSFINAMRRFVNRRGSPACVYSDNGSNFKGATSELKEFVSSLDKKVITDFATTVQIKWSFNPPTAPHMGGAWERLVRSVKEVMFGLVKDHILTDPQLLTLLTEAEAIVNSRPLTHISEDPEDLGALTPNHLLLGRHRNWASIRDTSEVDICSRKKYKQVQALAATFWKRWTKEYLPSLTTRPRGWRENDVKLQEGDLVLLQEDDVKRRSWPLARVTKVMPGKDGVIRVAEVRTKTGVYTRPVTRLYRLEDSDVRQGGEHVGDVQSPIDG